MEKSFLSKEYFAGSVLRCSCEIIMVWLFPYPFVSSEFRVLHTIIPKVYNFDQFLTFLCLWKSIFVLRLIPHITSVRNNISKKLYNLNGVPINNSLFVRVQFKERPLLILGCSLLLCTVVFGFAMQIFERGIGL